MPEIINRLSAQPLLFIPVIIVAFFLAYALIKRLIKIAFILIIIAAIGLAYLHYTGQDAQKTINNLYEKGKETVNDVKDKALELKKTNK